MSCTLRVRQSPNRVVIRSPGPQGPPGSVGGNSFESIWLRNPDDGLYYEVSLFGTPIVKLKIGQTSVETPP